MRRCLHLLDGVPVASPAAVYRIPRNDTVLPESRVVGGYRLPPVVANSSKSERAH